MRVTPGGCRRADGLVAPGGDLQLWGHCPHNLKIKAVKVEIAIELTTVQVAIACLFAVFR